MDFARSDQRPEKRIAKLGTRPVSYLGIAVVCTASFGESTGIRNLTDVGGKVVVK
jgi:hypothetical protein